MKSYSDYLNEIEEVGIVEKVFQSLIYVRGLPGLHPSEIVIFESGELGQVMSLTEDYAEVMLLSYAQINIDTKVARTNSVISIEVGEHILGKSVNALGVVESGETTVKGVSETRYIFASPLGIGSRKNIDKPFETGVTAIDLVVSLGKGQRELVVGDRKSGKTQFLMQCARSAVEKGQICIYAGIAKKRSDLALIKSKFKEYGVLDSMVLVVSGSSDPAPLVYLTPYTAMTYAEYFRDRGRDTLVILDDMTAHAKYYREISLLANRFPGRSSYPGDIFYIHSQLMERAGNFIVTKKNAKQLERTNVSITCLPVAELVMGDLSGYIQTNLMSMTDGHIYFDNNLYNEGRRPAINTFLSVTRVGKQAQTPLMREISSRLNSFLVKVHELEQFVHFGAELSEESKFDLARGETLEVLLNQANDTIVPLSVSILVVGMLWADRLKDKQAEEVKAIKQMLVTKYRTDEGYRAKLDTLIGSNISFDIFIENVKSDSNLVQ